MISITDPNLFLLRECHKNFVGLTALMLTNRFEKVTSCPTNGAPRLARFDYLGATPTSGVEKKMKIKNSLKSLKNRHRENRLVRRKGRVYIINKSNPRFKARQG